MFGSKIVPFLVLLLFLWLGADFHEQYMVKLIITRIHFFPFNFPCLNPGASCKFFNFPVNLVSNFIFLVNHFKSAVPLTYEDGSTCGRRNSFLILYQTCLVDTFHHSLLV